MIQPDPEAASWLRVVLAFAVVFGLLALFGYAVKRLGARGLRLPGRAFTAARRLDVVESLPLDVRRRLVIVRCDGREHLLLLGANQDIVVDKNLNGNPSFPDTTRTTT